MSCSLCTRLTHLCGISKPVGASYSSRPQPPRPLTSTSASATGQEPGTRSDTWPDAPCLKGPTMVAFLRYQGPAQNNKKEYLPCRWAILSLAKLLKYPARQPRTMRPSPPSMKSKHTRHQYRRRFHRLSQRKFVPDGDGRPGGRGEIQGGRRHHGRRAGSKGLGHRAEQRHGQIGPDEHRMDGIRNGNGGGRSQETGRQTRPVSTLPSWSATRARSGRRVAAVAARPAAPPGPPVGAPTGPSRQALVIGSRRSRPKFFCVILGPGGYWRRLYSAWSTSQMTRWTRAGSWPAAISCAEPMSFST